MTNVKLPPTRPIRPLPLGAFNHPYAATVWAECGSLGINDTVTRRFATLAEAVRWASETATGDSGVVEVELEFVWHHGGWTRLFALAWHGPTLSCGCRRTAPVCSLRHAVALGDEALAIYALQPKG